MKRKGQLKRSKLRGKEGRVKKQIEGKQQIVGEKQRK
jgi:hypothetical protein